MNNLFLTTSTTQSTTSILPQETTEKISALAKYWQSIDWEHLTSLIITKSILIILTTVIMGLVRRIGSKFIEKSFYNYKQKQAQSESRVETLYTLTSNIFQYTLFFIYAYALLTIIGIPVGSLLAGAGIAGVAIGLGAQGFINDFITGFFIILEKQIEVGDYVSINKFEGTVQSVGLRTTEIKSSDGIIHFIPNRSILVLSNLSKANRLAIIQLRIAPNANIEKIKKLIIEANTELTPKYSDILSAPEIVGIVDIGDGLLALKVSIKTLNGSQVKIQSIFLEEYIQRISEAGINIPQSPIMLDNTREDN